VLIIILENHNSFGYGPLKFKKNRNFNISKNLLIINRGRRDSTPVLTITESPKLSKFAKSNSRFRRSSIGTFIRSSTDSSTSSQSSKKPPPPKLDYRSMVSIDDMPALFVSFDSEYYFA
jgi:hypothetical protein